MIDSPNEYIDVANDLLLQKAKMLILSSNISLLSNDLQRNSADSVVKMSPQSKPKNSPNKISRSKVIDVNDNDYIVIKGAVINGSSLVNTFSDLRSFCDQGSQVIIDGIQYKLKGIGGEWSPNCVELLEDYEGPTSFDVKIAVSKESNLKATHQYKQLGPQPIPSERIQKAISGLDDLVCSLMKGPVNEFDSRPNNKTKLPKIQRKNKSSNANSGIIPKLKKENARNQTLIEESVSEKIDNVSDNEECDNKSNVNCRLDSNEETNHLSNEDSKLSNDTLFSQFPDDKSQFFNLNQSAKCDVSSNNEVPAELIRTQERLNEWKRKEALKHQEAVLIEQSQRLKRLSTRSPLLATTNSKQSNILMITEDSKQQSSNSRVALDVEKIISPKSPLKRILLNYSSNKSSLTKFKTNKKGASDTVSSVGTLLETSMKSASANEKTDNDDNDAIIELRQATLDQAELLQDANNQTIARLRERTKLRVLEFKQRQLDQHLLEKKRKEDEEVARSIRNEQVKLKRSKLLLLRQETEAR